VRDEFAPGARVGCADAIERGEIGVAGEEIFFGELFDERRDGLRVTDAAQRGGGAETHGGVGIVQRGDERNNRLLAARVPSCLAACMRTETSMRGSLRIAMMALRPALPS